MNALFIGDQGAAQETSGYKLGMYIFAADLLPQGPRRDQLEVKAPEAQVLDTRANLELRFGAYEGKHMATPGMPVMKAAIPSWLIRRKKRNLSDCTQQSQGLDSPHKSLEDWRSGCSWLMAC